MDKDINKDIVGDYRTNTILVLGNGFDIANKYETKYSQFIKFIKNEEYAFYQDQIDDKVYYEFIELIEENKFVNHFSKRDYKYWSDVENEMHRMINSIRKEYYEKRDRYAEEYEPGTTFKCIKLNKELNQYDRDVLLNFRMISKHNDEIYYLSKEYVDMTNGIIWSKVNEMLFSELVKFKKVLIIYLKHFVPIIRDWNIDQISQETKEQLLAIKPNHILTFNYTSYHKDYYECESINHVHGNLDEENIVLGYEDNDSDEDKNPNKVEFIRFVKYFQRIQNKLKPINRNDDIFLSADLFMSGLKECRVTQENVLVFYGLSFDYTDKDYIEELFSIPKLSRADIYYYNDEDYDNKVINLIKILGKNRIQNDLYEQKMNFIKIA